MSALSIDVWGPHGWGLLHTACATHVPERRRTTYRFLHRFADVLPCPRCQRHFVQVLHDTVTSPAAPALASREALMQWAWHTHNGVNERLGKPAFAWDAYRALYGATARVPSCGMGAPTKPPSPPWANTTVVVASTLLLVVVVLLLLVAHHQRRRVATSLS